MAGLIALMVDSIRPFQIDVGSFKSSSWHGYRLAWILPFENHLTQACDNCHREHSHPFGRRDGHHYPL
jgi:hypothetical protein